LMWILWPSFLAAGIGVGLVFTLIDPMELVVLGEPIHASRTAIYSLGFFVLWAIAALASAMSCFLAISHPTDDAISKPDQ
ncbi:MAG: hypothetical protein JNM52_03760, partial [Betaproteobacteria bacterium]|nr:hypothetical protein [Betaproteobacteria bacterium]